jgi:hypothetical protein
MITGMITVMTGRIGLANKTWTSCINPATENSFSNVPENPNRGISIYIKIKNAILEVIEKALRNLRLMNTHLLNLSNNDFSPVSC